MPRVTGIQDREQLDSVTEAMIKALTVAVEASTPRTEICTRSVPGFDKAAQEAVKEVKRAQRRLKRWGDDDSLEALKDARRSRKRAIQQSNRNLHRDKMASVTDVKTMWNLVKWARNRGTPSVTITP